MKKLPFMLSLVAMLGSATPATAALVGNGAGLIYDTVLDITWYDPTPTALPAGLARLWASGLTVGNTDAGSWRLPITPGTAWGYLHEGEMANLYDQLGNSEGGPLSNKGPFVNLQPDYYWTNTDWHGNPSLMMTFDFSSGYQVADITWNNHYVLAVHGGNVAGLVPEPETYALLLAGLGLVGLAARRKANNRQQ